MKITPVKQWRRQKNTASLIGQIGEILEWTIIHTAPSQFVEMAPYPVVIVRLKSNEKIIGQLVDYEKTDLVKGRKVEVVLRKVYSHDKEEIVLYTTKLKPLL